MDKLSNRSEETNPTETLTQTEETPATEVLDVTEVLKSMKELEAAKQDTAEAVDSVAVETMDEPEPPRKSNPTRRKMLQVLLALLPAVGMGIWIFGPRMAILVAFCVALCMMFEYLFNTFANRKNTLGDLSAAVTGVLLAFCLPLNLPLWMAGVGCAVAIVLGKQVFGGYGKNLVNPAILGALLLMVVFPVDMGTHPEPFVYIQHFVAPEAMSVATPLELISTENATSYLDLFLGIHAGPIGSVSAVALLVGGLFLAIRKILSPIIPLCYVGTVFVCTWLFGLDPVYSILSGSLLLGAIFMATDGVTAPKSGLGKGIFAVGCGLITAAFRVFAAPIDGVLLSILLMNLVTPLLNRFVGKKPAEEVAE